MGSFLKEAAQELAVKEGKDKGVDREATQGSVPIQLENSDTVRSGKGGMGKDRRNTAPALLP